MTLLGKIFRPWDLSSNETLLSKSNKNQDNESINVTNAKAELMVESDTPTTPPARKTSLSAPLDSNDSGGRVQCLKGESDKSSDEPQSLSTTPLNLINLGAGSANSMYQSNFLELNHPYYLPNSPMGTQTSSSSAASFMSTSSINELASLTRTELTAMGLLPPEPPASMKVKRQRPKRFRCPHCQVAFSNNGQLRGHIRIHTGERPFACEHEGCGKSFTRNEELTRHRRIHTGLRPYPCTHCGKKFGRKDHLKKHTRTHQRPMYNASSGMIGLGNPFHPYNPSLIPSHSTINEFGSPSSPFTLPFMLSIPPPISHFPFS